MPDVLCPAATSDIIHGSDLEKQSTTSKMPRAANMKIRINDQFIYDAILGITDGLTVPFALTAGLASIGSTRIVILGGLAELVAGAISMGLGGFLGAKSECETYAMHERECDVLVTDQPTETHEIVGRHFSTYEMPPEVRTRIVNTLLCSREDLKLFLLRHHFDANKPEASRPYISALVLGLSYFFAGFLALVPYFCVARHQVYIALFWSIGIMVVVMLVFGYCKTCVVRGWKGGDNIKAGIRGAVEMLCIGALAVGAAVGLVRAIEHGSKF